MAQVVEAKEYQRAKTEGYRKLRPKGKSQPLKGIGRGKMERWGILSFELKKLEISPSSFPSHLPRLSPSIFLRFKLAFSTS